VVRAYGVLPLADSQLEVAVVAGKRFDSANVFRSVRRKIALGRNGQNSVLRR
jgi:hypothetical protein